MFVLVKRLTTGKLYKNLTRLLGAHSRSDARIKGIIYYVEDDANIRDLAVCTLSQAGFETRGFPDAEPFFAACEQQLPDVILLDIMLPGIDGLEILRRLRSHEATQHLPIMMLTAKGSEIDKVQGLELGADDYLAKPFGMMELVARVRALYRRAQAPTVTTKTPNELHCNGIDLDMDAHTCTVQGEPVKLTVKEFDLLRMLIAHVGHALSRAQLFETVWGESFVGHSRTVDVHVQTLRQKLDRACSGVGKNIETVHGIGYRMRA